MSTSKLPVLFISHGGGPWPWIPDMREQFKVTESHLASLGKKIRPKSVLMLSGHWEESEYTVATSESPGMVYDYSGFPPHTYSIKYNAPGSVETALRVKDLLQHENIVVRADPSRGYDHGTFVPLQCMYPQADIPVAQLSLNSNYSPAEHFRIGEILKPLREEGVLIIGSGLSYHNLRKMFSGQGGTGAVKFEDWLTRTVVSEPDRRKVQLLEWENAPMAREAHPREDHLLPIMVIAGAAGTDSGSVLFIDHAFGVSMASYKFGEI